MEEGSAKGKGGQSQGPLQWQRVRHRMDTAPPLTKGHFTLQQQLIGPNLLQPNPLPSIALLTTCSSRGQGRAKVRTPARASKDIAHCGLNVPQQAKVLVCGVHNPNTQGGQSMPLLYSLQQRMLLPLRKSPTTSMFSSTRGTSGNKEGNKLTGATFNEVPMTRMRSMEGLCFSISAWGGAKERRRKSEVEGRGSRGEHGRLPHPPCLFKMLWQVFAIKSDCGLQQLIAHIAPRRSLIQHICLPLIHIPPAVALYAVHAAHVAVALHQAAFRDSSHALQPWEGHRMYRATTMG